MLCCPGASPTDRANGQTARGEALGGPADRIPGGDRQVVIMGFSPVGVAEQIPGPASQVPRLVIEQTADL